MENKKRDLSKFKPVRPERVDPDAVKSMVSMRLDNSIISGLKDEADRLGIPYQTLINSVLHRFVTGELVDKKKEVKAETKVAS
jgi:predicted DNA binding CopG/RHH family protein